MVMDYIIDPVAGTPSRKRTVNGNVCMHVDDLIFTGTDDFLLSFAERLKKSLERCDVLRTEDHQARCHSDCSSGPVH